MTKNFLQNFEILGARQCYALGRMTVLLVLLGFSWGRVFDLNKENFAAYLKGGGGPSSIGQQAFVANSASDLVYSSSVRTTSFGEFGFVIAGNRLNWLVGLEILRPETLKTIDGANTTGAKLFDLKSEITAVIPKIGIELNLKTFNLSRVYTSISGGLANLSLLNTYKFTESGSTRFGLADFSEDLRGTAYSLEGGFGFERYLSDTTTFSIEIAYRQLKVSKLIYFRDSAGFQGAKSKGDTAVDSNGSDRTLNSSSAFAAIYLRFYL